MRLMELSYFATFLKDIRRSAEKKLEPVEPRKPKVPKKSTGQIAEARVWSIARTQAEIMKDYNRPLRGTEPGLVGYWPLNEPIGATTAANLKRGGAAATATCFWSGAELVLDDPLPPGGTLFLVR